MSVIIIIINTTLRSNRYLQYCCIIIVAVVIISSRLHIYFARYLRTAHGGFLSAAHNDVTSSIGIHYV